MIEYDQLKLFLRISAEAMFGPEVSTSESSPMRFLERLEQENPAQARRSLRLGISDAMSWIRLEPQLAAPLPERLAAAGAPSIEMVRAYLSKKWSAIIKRGTIETDDEYYLIRELVDAPDLSTKERLQLTEMLDAYEIRRQGEVPPSKS